MDMIQGLRIMFVVRIILLDYSKVVEKKFFLFPEGIKHGPFARFPVLPDFCNYLDKNRWEIPKISY
jgi:hypothetical protein